MAFLTEAGSLLDDRSIQEASAGLHTDVVAHLLRFNHDPDHPSLQHFGRSALAELCLRARVVTRFDRSRLEATIQTLLDAGAKCSYTVDSKSIIYHALDNPEPFEVVKALLRPKEWKYVNAEYNIYNDPITSLCYSPIKYAELVLPNTPTRQKVVYLLGARLCKSRYWSEVGDQPPGAIGLPEHRIAAHKRREEEREREAMRERETQHKLRLERENAGQRKMIAQLEHEVDIQKKKEIHYFEQEFVREKNEMELEHDKALALQQQAAFDVRANAERELRSEGEQMMQRQMTLYARAQQGRLS